MGYLARLGNTLWRRTAHRDGIGEEMEFHLEERTAENLARGMSPREAREEALRRFGNPLLLRETTMEAGRLAWLEALLRDLGLAVRGLARRKGLAITAIGSLALGIGATTAVWSVVDAVLLQPLALPHSERLVVLEESKHGEASGSNPARLADWEAQVHGVIATAGFYGEGLVSTGPAQPAGPVRLRAIRTVGHPFAVLGLHPLLGRAFTVEEEAGRGERVVLLGESFWRRQFAADPGVTGKILTLSGEPRIVLGVVPDHLGYPGDFDLLLPAPLDVQQASRKAGFLEVVARLRPGVTPAGLAPELDIVARRLARQYPDSDAGRSARAVPLQDNQTGEARLPLLVLFGTVALVLLVTCVNIASLLLARAAERQREAAIRVSLGAGRAGLIRLYLAESLVLAAAGGLLGIALAAGSLTALKSLLPAATPRLASAHLDLRVAGFGLALSLLCGLAFGIAPALAASHRRAGEGLRTGHRSGASVQALRTRRVLVATQVLLSVVVLAGVGLLGKSLLLMQRAPLGIQADRVLTVRIDFPWDTAPSKLAGFRQETEKALAAIPGVRAVGVVDRLPLEGESQSGPIAVSGRALPADLSLKPVSHRAASASYFAAMGIPLTAGRLPIERARTAAAAKAGTREVLINATLARLYFPEGSALGRRITFDVQPEKDRSPVWFEIVGVVGNVRLSAAQSVETPEVFVLPGDTYWPLVRFAVRAKGDPRTLAAAVREAVHRIAPNQVIDGIATMDDEIGRSFAEPRTRIGLLGAFAALALWLAALGLYGVLSSDVTQRTHEIGVRLALGAHRGRVLREILWQGTCVALAGLLLGLAASALLARSLGALLFGVQPLDPTVAAVVSLVILTVAALASDLPARRASGVDPAVALRHE
jgi:predicted permease